MSRRPLPLALRAAAVAAVVGAPSRLASETLTLTTFYPSPLGVYRELITTGSASDHTLLARDAGRVGIGTSSPQALLHVRGRGDGLRLAYLQGSSTDRGLEVQMDRSAAYALSAQNAHPNGYGAFLSAPQNALYATASGGWAGIFSGSNGAWSASTSGGYGLYGVSSSGTGVFGDASSGTGVSGDAGTGTGVYGTSSSGRAVWGRTSGASNAVEGRNDGAGTGVRGISSTGWSGYFTGGQGLFADRILSTTNKIPVGMGAVDTGDPNFYALVAKPSCPAGYSPRILAGLVGTRTGGDVDSNDFVGVQVWSENASFWGVYAADCDQAACSGGAPVYMQCVMGSSRAGTAWYLTACVSGGAQARYGGCCGANNWCP